MTKKTKQKLFQFVEQLDAAAFEAGFELGGHDCSSGSLKKAAKLSAKSNEIKAQFILEIKNLK